MKLGKLGMILGAAILLCPLRAIADDLSDLRAQIQEIRQQLSQMDEMKSKLSDLERKLEESERQQAEMKKAQEVSKPTVNAGFPGAKLRIDGRIFTGIVASGSQGPNPHWSTNIPDAKLRFTFNPSRKIAVIARLSGNGASTASFDYMYLDYAGALGPANIIRIGQHKLDVGQETHIDNPIENILINFSVSHVSGTGTGVALLGRFRDAPTSPLYEAGFVNGPRGVMVRPTSSLPYNLKVGTPLPNNLFASASYYNSGRLRASDNSVISIAEIASVPSGASEWTRNLWELDLRYNYGSNGLRSVIPWDELPKLMLGATYGKFLDNATGAPDRDGNYWFVDGLVRLSSRLYTAARYSTVDLSNGVLAPLGGSPVPVNSYARTSLGLGYKLTDLTLLKTEYAFNNTSGGASKPSLNQWALGVASKF